MIRNILFLLIFFTLIPMPAMAADSATLDKRVQRLSEELRCLVCQNQSLADSNGRNLFMPGSDGAMTPVLKNTDYDTFFEPTGQIFADHMVKPRAKGPKPSAKSAPEPAWELLAMRAVISHALAWLKKVKPKAAQPEVDGLVEERPANYEEYLRRRAERGSPKKDAEKAAEELSKSMEELAAGVKGLADSGTHEMLYIAGIPGYQTQKAWFPQLTPFDRITQKQLEKVHKTLVRRKLDPAPAMSQLYGHFLAHCGHLGLDSKGPSDKVKPPRKS